MVRFSPRTDEARLLLPALEALRLRDIATSLWRHIRIVNNGRPANHLKFVAAAAKANNLKVVALFART